MPRDIKTDYAALFKRSSFIYYINVIRHCHAASLIYDPDRFIYQTALSVVC
jgi:hypothetical protein